MADFRRWITALAVVVLFAGLAAAQVPGGGGTGSFTCTATVAVPPALRAEGMTELIGDIVLVCTGGVAPTPGLAIPTANITVSLGTNVTSRILSSTGTTGLSEALLLIDEPGAPLPAGTTAPVPGFGQTAPQLVCGGTNFLGVPQGAGPGGCTAFSAVTANGIPVAVSAAGGTSPAANIFLGAVNGNQVTFNGIPILAPVSAGITRVFRITNVRANASGLGGGGLPGTTPLLASVSISGSTSVPVSNPVLTAGFIQAGLSVAFRNTNNTGNLGGSGGGFNQCGPGNTGGLPLAVGVLQFTENFGTAFKTRTGVNQFNSNGQAAVVQNIPGFIYNSESGFVIPAITSSNTGGISTNTFVAGLADYGTRLKAVFNNIPAGVRIFVSVTNLAANTSSVTTLPNASSFAVLVTGETAPEGSTVAPTVGVNSNSTALAEIPVVNGTATAVWEVYNTVPAANETLNFGVFTQFAVNVNANSPPPGTATVNLSFAPTPPVPFSTSAGSTASGVLTIPRFADTSTARNILTISICQTLLLFPFVTNQSGFDTGLAIANTSSDPIGTGAQAGTCRLSWYGDTAPSCPTSSTSASCVTPSVATGTVYANLASVLAPGFQGYTFALCNFQFAHGFAFISDLGARNLAMGYLALIVNNGSNLAGRNTTITGESNGH